MGKVALNDREDGCYICGTDQMLERHHIFPGRANRKLSEQYSQYCCVWLCHKHHNTPHGVHYKRQMRDYFQAMAQLRFENDHSHEEWMEIFKKNYI